MRDCVQGDLVTALCPTLTSCRVRAEEPSLIKGFRREVWAEHKHGGWPPFPSSPPPALVDDCLCSETFPAIGVEMWTDFLSSVITASGVLLTLPLCCSVTQLCLIHYDPMGYSLPDFLALHYFLEFAQTHVCWVDDGIEWFHPLSPPSPPAVNLSQHQGLFQWVISSPLVAKVLKLQNQSFQWIFRVDFL